MKKGIITVRIEKKVAESDDLVQVRGEEEAERILKANMEMILGEYGIMEDSNVKIDVRFEEDAQ